MITNGNNKKVKNIRKLQKSARARREQGLFAAEGIRMFGEIPRERLEQVFVSRSFYEKHGQLLQKREPDEILSDEVFSRLSETKTPQGVLALVRMGEYSREEMLEGKAAPLLLALENIQDPGNLGTIMRTAEGAGVDGIIMSQDTVDIYNPKVVRSTMGSLFRMPFVYVEDLVKAVEELKEKGIRVYGAHLAGKEFYREDYRKGTAFLIGNEGKGLTQKLANSADEKIRIPMKGKIESLNGAVAASLLVYEALRQRM